MSEKILDKKKMDDRIVEGIANRIRSEHRKHRQLDWAQIAALKIYATYNITLKDDTRI